jgi:hypothetical protein
MKIVVIKKLMIELEILLENEREKRKHRTQ